MDKKSPLISVITVVYNGIDFLEETIKSVIHQTYRDIEYIIMDGGSKDGTVDIIKRYEQHISYWSSKPDKGIYDAMNKGIDLASGKWIIFMNAGDNFYDHAVLNKIFSKKDTKKATFIYGDTSVDYGKFVKIRKKGDINDIAKGMQFSHQSVFIDTQYHKKYKLNIENKIIADFEFFYRSWKRGEKFMPIDVIVSTISIGGISDINRIDSILARWEVVGYKNLKISLFYISLILGETFKKLIKSILGKNLTVKLTSLIKN